MDTPTWHINISGGKLLISPWPTVLPSAHLAGPRQMVVGHNDPFYALLHKHRYCSLCEDHLGWERNLLCVHVCTLMRLKVQFEATRDHLWSSCVPTSLSILTCEY